MTIQRATMLLASVLTLGLAAACSDSGGFGSPQPVDITLSEFKIEAPLATFSKGAPYRFQIKNIGSVGHEWMIMPKDERDHMKSLVGIGQERLGPGVSANRQFTFPQAGAFEFACHLPGHYEAGMRLDIVVQ